MRNIILITCFFVLNNCSPANTVFLGPSITAVKTGSIYQASISYSSNKIYQNIAKIKKKTNENKRSFVTYKNFHFKNVDYSIENKAMTFFSVIKSDLKNNE